MLIFGNDYIKVD